MSFKPNKLCKLKKGSLIDTNDGFVDTFNWMVDYISNLKGDQKRIRVDTSKSDSPVIRYIGKKEVAESGDGIRIVGTDNSSAVCSGGKIMFASAEDANVVAKVSSDGAGNVIVTLGVYYR